ncbi:MAG: globin [Gammaproteobacteria bacterium]|jgi:hypothetical protein|nr:globin [Gammaproteobacteria bacterium]
MDKSASVVVQTLEVCAQKLGDITPLVFEQFFRLSPDGYALLEHSDESMQGRMFEAVIDLLMNDEALVPGGYWDWELDNHFNAYRVTPQMYQAFFIATQAVVRGAFGAAWTTQETRAWAIKLEQLMSRVNAHGTG